MNDLLSQVLDATANRANTGPSVVSVQNDPNKINWQAARGDLREAVKGGRGMTIVQAALSRAGLDESNGRINVVVNVGANGERPAWHALGTGMSGVFDWRTAADKGGANFTAKMVASGFYDNETWTADGGSFKVIRTDTNAVLASNVGKNYKVIQPIAAFDFLNSVLAGFDANYEAAGSLYGGKKNFALVHLPQSDFALKGSDLNKSYLLFTMGLDGTEAVSSFATNERVVCANLRRIALSKDGKSGVKVAHKGDVQAKLQEAAKVLRQSAIGFARAKDEAEALAATPVEPRKYAEVLVSEVMNLDAAKAAHEAGLLAAIVDADERQRREKLLAKRVERRENLIEEILTRHHSDTCKGFEGTAWGAYNAASETFDHSKLFRQNGDDVTRDTRRLESKLAGTADGMKQVAYQQALALAS